MRSITRHLRSFSFRIGMVIFCLLSVLLIGQLLLLHYQSVDAAYEDIRLIIDAHEEEMDEQVDRYGITHLKESLQAMSENIRDKHLFLLLKQKNQLTGNLKAWPALNFHGKDYAEITLPQEGSDDPLHLLVSVSDYPNDTHLLIGYDLDRVDDLKDGLIESLLKNLAIAFGVSLAASTLIVWLLSRHLRRFNVACDRVMEGNLDYRISTLHSNDEFDKLAVNINRMLDWNKTLIATVKDSSNAIAHDMRTPLSRLRLELQALAQLPTLDAEARAFALEHVNKVDSLVEMFENILNIARAESRLNTELFETLDLSQLVRDVVDFYAPVIEENKIKLFVSLPPAPVHIKGDKQLLGQAIVNLVDNACKYTPENGTINVTLETRREDARLIVADNGIGIPETLQEKVKERFFRVDTSRHTAGHGLGLSLVNAVATLHRGELMLTDNQPGLRATLVLHGVGG